MVNLNDLRENSDKYKKATADKQMDPSVVDKVLELDTKKRELQTKIQELQARRNAIAREKARNEAGREIKELLKTLEPELKLVEVELQTYLYKIPNLIHESVVIGKDESENVAIRKWGTIRKFDFEPLDHVSLGEKIGGIDIERAAKVSGTRFGYLTGDVALMEFALVMHAFTALTDESVLKTIANKVKKGYSSKPFIPVVPPVFVKPEVFTKMARLSPETEIERYHMERDDVYLVGSAEHTLGPMFMDEVLEGKNLPVRYVGFSTAFRREAGAYGKDTRGILRVHQFDKVEMESFTSSENGLMEQDFIVGVQEYLLQSLEIPYQVVLICTGDMGGPDFRQIDMEAWLPGQDKYREVMTSDYMTDYQSRRLNTKVRVSGKTEFAHMNDATAIAIGRTIIAILENYQQQDGSVVIPKVLQKWMGKEKIEAVKK